jgi:secreted PhoX family phosphatase
VSAYGGLIIAEDGDGLSHLVGSTESGEAFFFARNETGDSEFAGPAFSQDKKTLFVGIQAPGYVLASQGPFTRQK